MEMIRMLTGDTQVTAWPFLASGPSSRCAEERIPSLLSSGWWELQLNVFEREHQAGERTSCNRHGHQGRTLGLLHMGGK